MDEGVGLRPLACWNFGFDSCRKDRCPLVNVVCFQVEVTATGQSLVQMVPTEIVCVCVCVCVIRFNSEPLHLPLVPKKRSG